MFVSSNSQPFKWNSSTFWLWDNLKSQYFPFLRSHNTLETKIFFLKKWKMPYSATLCWKGLFCSWSLLWHKVLPVECEQVQLHWEVFKISQNVHVFDIYCNINVQMLIYLVQTLWHRHLHAFFGLDFITPVAIVLFWEMSHIEIELVHPN